MTSLEGQTLKGKYQLEQLLGSGGMGEVYRARNVLVDRTVAIKVLRAEFAANAQVVERFMREAKAANVVSHRHIVDVLDIDKTDEGTMFIVQEYLEGEDLASRLQAQVKGIEPAEALDLLIPVVEAVGAAHARGVVHRDLKPDNVFLAMDGDDVVPKVLDFGISKVPLQDKMRRTALGVGDAPKGVRLTAVGAAMGTPLYMSPEQIKDPASVDARGDVWSLGIMLYETLSGRVPFDAEDLASLFAKICSHEPPRLDRVEAKVPADLAQIIQRCLRPERAERYEDATTLAERLRRCRLRMGEQVAAARGRRDKPTMLSGPPPPMSKPSPAYDVTMPDSVADSARAAGDSKAGVKEEPADFGLELDLPSREPAPQAAAKAKAVAAGGADAAPSRPAASAPAATGEATAPEDSAAPEFGSAFGLFDDEDDAPALDLELQGAPPDSSSRAEPRRGRDGAPSTKGRVKLTGVAAAPSPSMLGEAVRCTVAIVVCAALAAFARHGAAAELSVAHQTLGVDGYLGFAGAAAAMLGVVVWLVIHAARWGFASLFVTAVCALALSIAAGTTALVLAAPGLVGGTFRMIALFALPWAAVAVAAGFVLYSASRALQLLRTRGAKALGAVFALTGVLCVGAAVWILRQPLPSVAAVSQIQLVPVEAQTRERAAHLAATVAGARAIGAAVTPTAPPVPRSGGVAPAALKRSAPP
ncbi:MAG: serine/threonine protein kinase [Deltaproteobacteria bacterium]|jgi:serine/threonine-protein kinase|nr:serine/threonine protein kinase [Deltaproteobacteria bacterium]MBW2532257.1 serine/threonine protein kinase [Deltaproteobacteria bacterium]